MFEIKRYLFSKTKKGCISLFDYKIKPELEVNILYVESSCKQYSDYKSLTAKAIDGNALTMEAAIPI